MDALAGDVAGMSVEVARLERQLAASRERLRQLEAAFREKTLTLERAGRELGVARRELGRRLVELYTSNEPDAASVLLGADSLDELIDLLELHDRVAEADAELVDRIEGLRSRVTRERRQTRRLKERQARVAAGLEHRTNERRGVLAELVARRDALADVRAARQRTLASVQVERREWEAQADALEAESRRVAAVIAAAPPAAAAPDVHSATPDPAGPSTSGFVWPVRGTLVSPYGQRWGRLHAGIDVAAPAGTPVVAAGSGRVVYAGSMSGYGLIVVIDHGGGIATAYAHNSSIGVSVGQSVGRGQTIAAVGCTGTCFGDHVHFEVRLGGSPVDPLGYL